MIRTGARRVGNIIFYLITTLLVQHKSSILGDNFIKVACALFDTKCDISVAFQYNNTSKESVPCIVRIKDTSL
jgi:hypothetical protein